jgi:malonate-semialdehyde dehydrogenase (acetylating)/methylmalonate-semialdehyde dehydrogenase
MEMVALPKEPLICRNLAGGRWLAVDGARTQVKSPYTGQVIGEVPDTPAADVDRTVREAHAAFAAWRRIPIKERSQPLFRFR